MFLVKQDIIVCCVVLVTLSSFRVHVGVNLSLLSILFFLSFKFVSFSHYAFMLSSFTPIHACIAGCALRKVHIWYSYEENPQLCHFII